MTRGVDYGKVLGYMDPAHLDELAARLAQEALFNEVCRRLAKGYSTEQIAREIDLPGSSHVEKLLLRADFETFFAERHPDAYRTWKRARDEEEAEQVVKSLARANAIRNYKALQSIADGEELKPDQRAKVLETLLKMSGTIAEETQIEVVKISAQHLNALRESASEID